jgi:transposase
MSISEHKHVSKAEGAAQRIEIFTGAGRRRSWSSDEKATIVAESCESGVKVCHVARRHGLTPQQLFGWRREARRRSEGVADGAPFVPAIVEAVDAGAKSSPCREDAAAPTLRPHAIELEISGASVWIWRDADAAMVTAIVGALKASK